MNITALRLRMLRKERHLSQQEVADVLHITRTAYNKYESGAIQPTRKIKELSEFFGVSADYILGQDNRGTAVSQQESRIENQVHKYIDLSDSGRNIVDITLNAVYQLEKQKLPE